MSNVFLDTDKLSQAYCDLIEFQERCSYLIENQKNIKTGFLNSLNDESLRYLLNKANKILDEIYNKSEIILDSINQIDIIAECCNDAVVDLISSLSSTNAQVGLGGGFGARNGNASNEEYSFDADDCANAIKKLKDFCVKPLDLLFSNIVKPTVTYKKVGKKTYVLLSNYTREMGLGSRYKKSTWVKKQAGNIGFFDAVNIGLDFAIAGVKVGSGIAATWSDEEKATEEKVYDTIAYSVCGALDVGLRVGADIAGKAVTAAIPIPGLNVVAGVLVDKAIEVVADAMLSEAVVNQVSDSIEKTVGAVKAGIEVVSDAAKKVLESENVGDAIVNTASLVGEAVVAGAKVVGTAIAETAKSIVTVAKEAAKIVEQKVTNVVNWFKRW